MESSYKAAVITVSDGCAQGQRTDTSGPRLCRMLEQAGYTVAYTVIVPDDQETIESVLRACCDEQCLDLVLTTGGTGLSPRDVTPDATRAVLTREIPAIATAMLMESLKITPHAMLSRAAAGTRGGALIVNLPGSEKGAAENLNAILPALEHGLKMMTGAGH